MPTGFGAALAGLARLKELAIPATYVPTAEEKGNAALARLKDMYGVYQEGDPHLADSTVLARDRLGVPADEPLLITGGLRDANTVSVTETAEGVVIELGMPAGDPHATIAQVQERGDLAGHVPPRPRYRRVGEEMGPEIVAAFSDVIAEHIRP